MSNTVDVKFSMLYYRDGRLVAADAIDAPADFIAVKKALATGGHVPAERAGDLSVPLRLLVTTDPSAQVSA